MALNIKDPETEQLAREVAAITGESKTGAVRTSLRERKERLAVEHPSRNRGQALRNLLEDEIWPTLPPTMRGHAPSPGEQDEMLGYEPREPETKDLAKEIVSAMLVFRDGDGYPVFNRKRLPAGFEDAIWVAAFPSPADPALPSMQAEHAERLKDARNAVKVELSRDQVEDAIVKWSIDNVKPPLTDKERETVMLERTPTGADRPSKFVKAAMPDRLVTMIEDAYKRNDLKLPENLGGTKTIGTTRRRDRRR